MIRNAKQMKAMWRTVRTTIMVAAPDAAKIAMHLDAHRAHGIGWRGPLSEAKSVT